MNTPEKCADCPLQELLDGHIAKNEQQLTLAQTVLDNLQAELEYEQINTALRLVLFEAVESALPGIEEHLTEVKTIFERNRAAIEEAAGMAIRHAQERLIWTRHEIDALQVHRQRMSAYCSGPRAILMSGLCYVDGQPRMGPKCTGRVEDIVRTLQL